MLEGLGLGYGILGLELLGFRVTEMNRYGGLEHLALDLGLRFTCCKFKL